MRKRQKSPLPAALARARERIEDWRKTRTERRMPEPLWNSVVKLAGRYGIHATSKALRVNYEHLKKRVKAAGSEAPEVRSTPSFVEVLPGGSSSTPECVVEIENPRGTKMRIHFKGTGAADLSTLGRLFWGAES